MTTTPAAGTQAPRIFRFADLEVDEGRQRVRRGSNDVPLPKLSFDLLLVLLAAAPNFVSHRQLMQSVWPGIVVGDKTVTQRVKLLRDALGDDPDDPRYIEGLRGRGYRILTPVTPVPSHLPEPAGPSAARGGAPILRRAGRSLPFSRRMLAGAAVVVALLSWSLWNLWPRPAHDELPAAQPAPLPETTVAVLAFRDPGGGNAELALGVPDAVLDALSTSPDLTVIARASSLGASQQEHSVRELSQLLGARYLVGGSIQRADNALRVSAQLVDAVTGTEIWAAHYDVGITDIFDLQDEIAASVADALSVTVTRTGAARPARPTDNIDAYLAYLRGRALLGRWTRADADAAARAFEMAIELDPRFGTAYAQLYDARLMAADRRCGHANPAASSGAGAQCGLDAAKAEEQALIDKALALDPHSGEAYFARAMWADGTTASRESDFRRGLALDPSNGRGITAFAEYLDHAGRGAEAEELLNRAIRVDPLSPRAYFWRVMRDDDADVRTLEDGMLGVLEVDPDYVPALQRYAKYRWLLHGEVAHGIRLIEHALSLDPSSPWLLHTAIAMYLDIGDADTARALQAGADVPPSTGRILLALHAGDAPGAAGAAVGGLGFLNGKYENWGVYDALRVEAVASGEHAVPLAYLQQHLQLGDPGIEIALDNFRAVPAFAQLQMLAGQVDEAHALLHRCIRWIDEEHLPRLGGVYALRIKAEALMLLGDADGAIAALDASFAAQDYTQWWYTLERDPIWLPLHDDARFVSIVSAVRRHIEQQRQQLQVLLAQGVVPRRDIERGP